MMATRKRARKSKTVWFGSAVAVLSVVQAVLLSAPIEPITLALVGSGIGVAIVWLRFVSNEPIR